MKKNILLVTTVILIFLCSCTKNYSKISNKIDYFLSEKEDAVSFLEKIIEEKKIILIGTNDHSTINDTLFLNYETLCKLYKKGLRYVLLEGGLPNKSLYNEEDLINKNVMLFYPWESVGVQYIENSIIDNVLNINKSIAKEDPIKLIGLEGGRENFAISDQDENKINNYRDKYMYQNALHYINNSNKNEKVLINCGAAHGCKNIIKEINQYDGTKYDWYTLGYHLYNKFQNDFISISFVSLDSYVNDSIYYKSIVNSNWSNNLLQTKVINPNEAKEINKYIYCLSDIYKSFDNFFIVKNLCYR